MVKLAFVAAWIDRVEELDAEFARIRGEAVDFLLKCPAVRGGVGGRVIGHFLDKGGGLAGGVVVKSGTQGLRPGSPSSLGEICGRRSVHGRKVASLGQVVGKGSLAGRREN